MLNSWKSLASDPIKTAKGFATSFHSVKTGLQGQQGTPKIFQSLGSLRSFIFFPEDNFLLLFTLCHCLHPLLTSERKRTGPDQ